jgi:hypothetical protein
MKMPFGKHKGKDINFLLEFETGYFIWLTTIELKGDLAEYVKAKANSRQGRDAIKEYYNDKDSQNDAYQDYIIMDKDWQWK